MVEGGRRRGEEERRRLKLPALEPKRVLKQEEVIYNRGVKKTKRELGYE